MGPDVELRVHALEVAGVTPGDAIEPAERPGAGVVGEALGLEHGGRRAVVVAALRGHPRTEAVDGALGGEGGLDLVVIAEPAVVVEPGIQAGEVDVPSEFDVVGGGPQTVAKVVVGVLDFPRFDGAPLVAKDLLGGFDPVGPGHERGVAEELEGEARRLHVDLRAGDAVGRADGGVGHGRLDPLEEIRRAVARLGENPRAVLDVRHRCGGAVGIDEILRRGRPVAGGGRSVEELRRGLAPRTRTAAPGVVAVGRGHDDDRAGRVGRVGRDEAADLADALVGVAVAVGEDVVGRHRDHGLLGAGVRVDVFDAVELVGVGADVPGGVAGVGLGIPPLRNVVETRADLVGLVRRAAVDVVGAGRVGAVVVTRAGAADVMAGDDDPLVAFIDEDIDEVARVGHLGGEKSLRVVAEVRVAVPRLPPSLLEDLEFLAEDGFREQRGERVVVGEADEIHARGTGRSGPPAGLAVAVRPAGAVAEVVAAAELADVVDERAGVADGETAARIEAGQGVARSGLVGVAAVVEAEDVGEVVLRVLGRAEATVVLPGLQDDRVPSVLHA